MATTQEITVYAPEEVEDIDYWTPGHGLEQAKEALAKGKKVVFLGACDCGCWDRGVQSKKALEMIKEAGLEGQVYHNLFRTRQDRPVILLPPELRPDEYSVAISAP